MLCKWSRVVSLRSVATLGKTFGGIKSSNLTYQTFSTSIERVTPSDKDNSFSKDKPRPEIDCDEHRFLYKVSGNVAFMSKPRSLALSPNSKFWVQEPEYKGIQHFFLKLLLYYSKESTSIRNANVLYKRIVCQVDRPEIYHTFNLEKCFRTTFALLVLHMWLCLSRLKVEGKEGVEFGQYLYEHYNRDLELRVAAAGVNLLLTKWLKDLEKIFYGNVAAYDDAIQPVSSKDELPRVIWRNVFSDEDAPMPKGSEASAVQALASYTRREYACLTLTDKAALFSGNMMFTSLRKSGIQPDSSQL